MTHVYRAELSLDGLDVKPMQSGHTSEFTRLHVAEIKVTGASPADALAQMQRHIAELTEWHTQLERDAPASPEEEQTSGR